jgi:hypothetical protein
MRLTAALFEIHDADVLAAEALRGAGEGGESASYVIHAMGRGPPRVASSNASGRAHGTSPRWQSGKSCPGSSTCGLYLKVGLAAVLVSVGVRFICNDLVGKSPSEVRWRSSQ